jgi:hypothetical protein
MSTRLKIPRDLSKSDNFYYDESGNIRKLKLNNGRLSSPTDKPNFVLAGLIAPKDKVLDTSSLINSLKLQQTVKEIKYHNLVKNTGIQALLNSDRIIIYLKWLLNNDIKIHVNMMNWIYYPISEIVDALFYPFFAADPLYQYERELASTLYLIVCSISNKFFNFLSYFDYPKVPTSATQEFLDGLMRFVTLGTFEDDEYESYQKTLIELIQRTKMMYYLSFTEDAEKGTIISNFINEYYKPVVLFPKCAHVFDQETSISTDIEKMVSKGTKCHFVDSRNNILIQLSDVIAGIFAVLTDYTAITKDDEVNGFAFGLSAKEKSVLTLIGELIDKADSYSRFTIIKNMPYIEEERFARMVRLAKI